MNDIKALTPYYLNQLLVTGADFNILLWLTPDNFIRREENLQSQRS